MGARQSKRSVDISGTPKKGELENGAVATTAEEKLEKIPEGDVTTTKVNANGSTTTTSTVTAEQQETAAASSPAESGEAPSTKTEVSSEQADKPADVSAITVDEKQEPTSPTSPSENATSNDESVSSEKKKKPKKKWSFRSFSFSKKDKVKPASKEEKQETVPEGNENTQSEQVSAAEATTVPAVQSEEPPPLPTSPPPTPADETAAEKEETPTISEGDVDASGGGEGLAEPIDDVEIEETIPVAAPVVAAEPAAEVAPTPVAAAPLTNGVAVQNGDYKEQNGKHTEEEDEASPVHERKPSVDSVTAKIGSLKLQITSENSEQPATNGVSDEVAPVESNGVKENDVSSTEKAAVAAVEN